MSNPAIEISAESTSGGRTARQTIALFQDAYRELNAKKLFWIVMLLSGLAMAGFAVVGVTPAGISIAGYQFDRVPFVSPQTQYKYFFNLLLVGYWLCWAAMILAIVSTAGIFPEFLSGGSVDLFISKPIGRLRLFLTKYATGLLFVFLQVSVFTLLAFFVMGFRGTLWEPHLFLAIPIVICLFSFLYSIATLLGVLTRSTIAALMLTVLIWALAFVACYSEVHLQASIVLTELRMQTIDKTLEKQQSHPATKPAGAGISASFRSMLGLKIGGDLAGQDGDSLLKQRQHLQENLASLKKWHAIVWPIYLVLPKTTETTDLLSRSLVSEDEVLAVLEGRRTAMRARFGQRGRGGDFMLTEDVVEDIKRSRSIAWIMGTSFGFEAGMLALAAWVFCRRDY